MDSLRDLARRKTLSGLSYLILALWCIVGGFLFLIFLTVENLKPSSDISCDEKVNDNHEKNSIREKCYDDYYEKYSKFPVYAFVLINFFSIAIVPIIYSRVLKSRVNELETHNENVEEQLRQNQSRFLFTAYCCQLAATIVLATVFIIILQTRVFNASTHFPSNFKCNPGKQGSNSAAFSSTNGSLAKTDIYTCKNRRATQKFAGSVALTVFNGIWAIFALIELVWIFSRARNGLQFMYDPQFYADHLRSNRGQEQRPQQSEEAVLLPESALRSPRDSGQVSARSLPEQHMVIEAVSDRSKKTRFKQAELQADFLADHLRSNREQEPQSQQSEETVIVLRSDSTRLLDTALQPTRDSGEVGAGSFPEQQPELQAKLKRLKDCIKIRTERLEDLNQPIRPQPGEGPKPKDLELDQIFVKLVIHKHRAKYDFPTDRREQLKVFPKPKSNQSVYVPWQDIIDGNNKNILFVGRPGIGKTILSTKLLRGSAFNEFVYQNFDAAFLVKFRHYNSRGEDLDLRKLLSCSETVSQDLDDEVWNYIITNPTKVLLIFDGIDEFNARSAISNDDSHFNDSEEEKMPLYYLYKKIASGKLLKGATVITTLRPTASSCVRQLRFDKVFEILGFTSEEVEDYVTRFTKEDQNPETEKKAIWQHISTNVTLFTLCYVPVNCFIICSCLSWWRSRSKSLPTKLTKIYSTALKIFYFRHSDKYRMSEEARDQLFLNPFHELPTECKEEFQRLGEIAFDGIKEGRLLFTSEEVKGLEDCGLLHRLPDLPSQEGLDEDKAQYCFIHLTFQEFLAARHVVDNMTEAQALEQFITDHINEGSWQLVVQFVAGLLVDTDEVKQLQFSEILMKLLPMSTSEVGGQLGREDAECMMTEKPTALIRWPHGQSETNLAVTICKCLYELDIKQESSITSKMEEISFDEVWFSECELAPADCTAILHLLKNRDEKFKLFLRSNFMGDLGCMEIKKWIVKSNCVELDLTRNNMGEKGVEYLCDTLKLENCNLTVLVLDGNHIGDKAAELLSTAIKDGNCKLTRLNLNGTKIGVKGVEHLKDALKCVNNNLTELNLAYNDIGHEGAKYLSDSLKCENCKLTLLNLRENCLGDKGAEHLSNALKDVKCKLSALNLSENIIGAKGAEVLSDALKDKNCYLIMLNLGVNNVGDKGAELLRDSLKDAQCELTVLDLAKNKIGDIGAKHLSNAIKDGNCKLTQLHLSQNNIGEKGVEYLSNALKCENCKLTVLNLQFNAIGDQGAKHISDALKDRNRKLPRLRLRLGGNHIGEKVAEQLGGAFIHLGYELYLK